MIPQRNISLISNTLASAGGRRIPEAVIERDWVLAWFLTGPAGHPLREVLAFKGGTALRRCRIEGYRFSEDLAFTLTRPMTLENILAGLGEFFAAVEAACGLRIAFEREDRHSHQNSHTFYLRYQGPLPAANDVKVDITINEVPADISRPDGCFIECGDPHHGFARVYCDACGHDYLLADSCKTRYFCPGCQQNRVLLYAEWVEANVLAPVAHRQYVFTVAKLLRPVFGRQRAWLGELCRIAARLLSEAYAEAAPRCAPRCPLQR